MRERTSGRMHGAATTLALALGMAACASPPEPAGPPLHAELFPFEPSEAHYRVEGGGERTLRLEATADPEAVDLFISGDGLDEQRMTVRRDEAGLRFANGPGPGLELVRFGARPGDVWESGRDRVRFDGWERISVPAGTFDAARLTASRGTDELRLRQTWWFADGSGIVRIRDDRGALIISDLVRVAP